MRPLRLEVEGFTCFSDTQEPLNFEGLELFAITGPTGAGKTSVLDSMTYALYGHVPRLGKAGSDVISLGRDRLSVIFDFALGVRRYRIARTVRRGGAAAKAILEELTATGETLIADRVNEVNEAVEKLTGLSFEAFTQSLMLPQGKFDTFLNSKPAERQKRLRELLRLDVYEVMRAEAEKLRSRLDTEISGQEERLLQDYADVSEERLTELKRQLDEDRDRLSTSTTHQQRAATLLNEIQQTWNLLAELNGANQELSVLSQRKRTIDTFQAELQAARRADSIMPVLSISEEARERTADAVKHVAECQKKLDAIKSIHSKHAAQASGAEVAAAGVGDLRRQLKKLDEIKGVVERRVKLQRSIQILNQALSAARAAVGTAERKAVLAAERKETAEEEERQAKEFRSALQFDENLDDRLQEAVPLAATLAQSLDDLATESDELEIAIKGVATTDRLAEAAEASHRDAKARIAPLREKAKNAAAELQDARDRDAALVLRRRLHVGASCPVCDRPISKLPSEKGAGVLKSLEASATRAAADLTEAEEELRQRAGDASEATTEARAARRVHSQAQKRHAATVKAVATGESAVRRALRDGSKLTGSALAKWVNSEARRVKIIRTKVDSADGRIRRAELQLANAKLDGQSATAEARQATGKLRNTQERLDEDCRELADAVKRISAVTTSADPASERSRTGAQIEALEERRRVAGATLAQSEKEIASARTGLQYATSTASKAEAEALRAERRLEQALAKAEFLAATDARKAIRDPAAQARLEKQITEYESSHTTAFQAVDRLKATLAGRSVSESELAVAKQRLEEIRAERDALQLSVVQRQQDVLRLEKALGKALSLREAAERSRAKLVLYRTLSTDLGSAAFQRFLLEEAFADMVSGASKRLRELTGRYTLAWDDGEFFVVDHDNASERRRAETLSGGETFLASLSLALQLSDQVLQTSGAVRLDSLFIDEGFGTLDPATLDVVGQAIEALQVGGRMVGIITHIAALTERLPGCVRISKGPNSARWNVERVG